MSAFVLRCNTSITSTPNDKYRVFSFGELPSSDPEFDNTTRVISWVQFGIALALLFTALGLLVARLLSKRGKHQPNNKPFSALLLRTPNDGYNSQIHRRAVLSLIVQIVAILYFFINVCEALLTALFGPRFSTLCIEPEYPSSEVCRWPGFVFRLLETLDTLLILKLYVLLTLFWGWLSDLLRKQERRFELLLLDFWITLGVGALLYLVFLAFALVFWNSHTVFIVFLAVVVGIQNICVFLLFFWGARLFQSLRAIDAVASPFAIKLFALNSVAILCIAIDDIGWITLAVAWPQHCVTTTLLIAYSAVDIFLCYLPVLLLLIAIAPRKERFCRSLCQSCRARRKSSSRSLSTALSLTAGESYDSFVPDIDRFPESSVDSSFSSAEDEFSRDSLFVASKKDPSKK